MWEYVRLHLTQTTTDIKDCYTTACIWEYGMAIRCLSGGHSFWEPYLAMENVMICDLSSRGSAWLPMASFGIVAVHCCLWICLCHDGQQGQPWLGLSCTSQLRTQTQCAVRLGLIQASGSFVSPPNPVSPSPLVALLGGCAISNVSPWGFVVQYHQAE